MDEAAARLARPATRALCHTTLDTEREQRCGHPEVDFEAGKSPDELVDIARAILRHR